MVKEPPLVVSNAAVVRVLWNIVAQIAINVYGARVGAGTTINQALADSLGAAIKAAFTGTVGPLMSNNTQLVRVTVRDIRTAGQPEFRDSGALVLGTGLGDSLPPKEAACITLRTAGAGRSFRGRSYIGGFSEAENDANGLTVTAANTAAMNFVAGIRDAMTANGLTLVVLSRPSFREVRTVQTFDAAGALLETHTATHAARPGMINNVTMLEARDARWQTQRRRDNGRGGQAALASVASITF